MKILHWVTRIAYKKAIYVRFIQSMTPSNIYLAFKYKFCLALLFLFLELGIIIPIIYYKENTIKDLERQLADLHQLHNYSSLLKIKNQQLSYNKLHMLANTM